MKHVGNPCVQSLREINNIFCHILIWNILGRKTSSEVKLYPLLVAQAASLYDLDGDLQTAIYTNTYQGIN